MAASVSILPPRRGTDGRDFRLGVRDGLRLLPGLAPFALAVGVAAASGPAPDLVAWSGSWLLYAGASQLAVLGLLGSGAAPVLVVVTALVMNARLAAYSVALVPRWRGASGWWRALASYLLVDPVYAVVAAREASDPDSDRAYYIGLAAFGWCFWQLSTAAGVLLAAIVPSHPVLLLAAPLTIAALAVRLASTSATRVAAVSAAGVGLLAAGLPAATGVLVAAAAGIAVALVWERAK
jgi:predicted branched-subunit amino acid permease